MPLKVAFLNNAYAPTKPFDDLGIQVVKRACKTTEEVIETLRDTESLDGWRTLLTSGRLFAAYACHRVAETLP